MVSESFTWIEDAKITFSVLGLVNFVNGLCNLIIEPLFKLIQNDDDVNFVPVSTAFAVACALCLLQIAYNWSVRQHYISTKENFEEISDASNKKEDI